MSSDNSEVPVVPWETSSRRDLDAGRLYRAVLQHRADLLKHYPWVTIPQVESSFTFGFHRRQLPLGALLRVWEHCPLFQGSCPQCYAPALGIAGSGYLSAGRMSGVCIGCGLVVSRWVAGLGRITSAIRPVLNHTPFYLQGGWGLKPEGPPIALLAVLQELGAADLPQRDSPSFQDATALCEDPPEEVKPRKPAQARPSRRKSRQPTQRRYLVKEVVLGMAWSGAIWAVGCSSRAAAVRSFQRRVARNVAESGEQGTVLAFDREARQLICWSDQVVDPEAAARWWLR